LHELKTLLKYLLGVFSVVVFLTATTGVRVYSHYCSSEAVANTSIIESLAPCEHYADKILSTQTKAEKSCCHSDSHCEVPQADKDDCCSSESQFFRVSDDFTIPAEEQWKVSPKEIIVAIILMQINNLSIENTHSSNGLISVFHSPPPISGRKLIVFLQQQKTDPNPIT